MGDARRVGDKRGIRAQHLPFDARRKGSESTICVPFLTHPARSSRRFVASNLPSAAATSHDPVSTRGSRPRAGAGRADEDQTNTGLREKEESAKRRAAWQRAERGSKSAHPPSKHPYLLSRLGASAVRPDVEATPIPRMIPSGAIVEPGGGCSRRGEDGWRKSRVEKKSSSGERRRGE